MLSYGGCHFNAIRREAQALYEYSEMMLEITNQHSFRGWMGMAMMCHGAALILTGNIQEGELQLRAGIAHHMSIGDRCYMSSHYGYLAEGQAKTDQQKKALTTLGKALALVEELDERYYEAELHRLRGEFLLQQGDVKAAEVSFTKAVEVAHGQDAKSWELRAATDLARLWQTQGKSDEAYELLASVYDWFTEGFDTPDLVAAKRLLEELS